jgi:hypothetical protein
MNSEQVDILTVVNGFQKANKPTRRYSSFDYCYNYFRTTPSENIITDSEKSCLVLGFYLASWGMMRGSSFLLTKSSKYFEPLIVYLAKIDKAVWDIDVDNYTDKNIQIILNIYSEIKIILIPNKESDLTLITKVLMGVFGFVPAFDKYFCETFRIIYPDCGFRRFNEKSLKHISDFYKSNKNEIDKISNDTFTLDFKTGESTKINYPKAKIIDMYGFTKSYKNENQNNVH